MNRGAAGLEIELPPHLQVMQARYEKLAKRNGLMFWGKRLALAVFLGLVLKYYIQQFAGTDASTWIVPGLFLVLGAIELISPSGKAREMDEIQQAYSEAGFHISLGEDRKVVVQRQDGV